VEECVVFAPGGLHLAFVGYLPQQHRCVRGTSPADFVSEVIAVVHVVDDVDAALDRSKGWYFDHARHDDPELDRLIDDDLVRKFAVAGTPKECAELLGTALDLGFTSLSCNLVAVRRAGNTMKSGLSETISAFAEVFERRGW